MKIITILGSPRRRGNTATVLARFEDMVSAEHQVDRLNITDHVVKGCLGCDACFKVPDAPGCVQRDDAGALFERILAADVIIYATPLYSWSFTAQMKTLVDRHYCLVKWADGRVASALYKGKRAALLVTCGDAAANNADLIQEIFDREMRYLGGVVVGKYIVPDCTTPDRLGEKAEQTAREMYGDICQA